jgi:hypothetical protein
MAFVMSLVNFFSKFFSSRNNVILTSVRSEVESFISLHNAPNTATSSSGQELADIS